MINQPHDADEHRQLPIAMNHVNGYSVPFDHTKVPRRFWPPQGFRSPKIWDFRFESLNNSASKGSFDPLPLEIKQNIEAFLVMYRRSPKFYCD